MRFLCVIAVVLPAAAACAQGNTKSQLGVVSQSIDGARVEITYRRPVARGRELFGALVPWGKPWTPSADSGARMSTTSALEINGQRLAAGRYSIWAIPDSTRWTIIFNSVAETFHRSYPAGHDALRVQATPSKGEHVETLMFAFPLVDADSARLELRWGTTVVPLSIKVPGG
ncbi:MAG: DUF2911 domain-containing protein [Gemmatimonadales bacterium]